MEEEEDRRREEEEKRLQADHRRRREEEERRSQRERNVEAKQGEEVEVHHRLEETSASLAAAVEAVEHKIKEEDAENE